MHAAMEIPSWVLALVAAALAPFCARALASAFDRRSRDRSARLLAPLLAQRVGSSRTDSQIDTSRDDRPRRTVDAARHDK
jgi:hypothetical protein